MYTKIEDGLPEEGTLCIVECTSYCEEGFMVATYRNNEFVSSADDEGLNDHVTAWLDLDELNEGFEIDPDDEEWQDDFNADDTFPY